MATLVLTVVGGALAGPFGAAIGATIGQVFDSTVLFAPKGREGPRLNDLRVQTSRYGDQIPQLFGAMRVAGSVIWSTDLKEQRDKKKGGKGQPSVTTYSYSASFAVALSSRRIASIGRIWADGNLLRGSAGDFKTAIGAFRFYDGSPDQAADPLIAADKGAGVVPAHRGMAYAVFEDLQLADYGNRIPSLTFEVVADSGDVSIAAIAAGVSDGAIASTAIGAVPAVHGYAASGNDVASALRPLIGGLGIAVRGDNSGLMLDAGTASEATVGQGSIGARFNGKEERGLRLIRSRAEDVPVRLNLRHYDPARDFQAGIQTALRPGAGRKEDNLDMPAALTAASARGLAEGRLQRLWAGRSGMELRCDWRALPRVAGSVITVEGQQGRWRIEESEWEGIGVRLTLRQVGGTGVAVPPASAGNAVSQADVSHGVTVLQVADLPVTGDEVPTAPVVVAAASGASSGWRAAELFVEDAATGGLTSIGPSAAPAILGVAVTTPVALPFAHIFDTLSAVEVDLVSDAMILTNADDLALASGSNAALLGRELIQFGKATQTGPNRWRLERLMRGRRGTEWAMATHSVGESFLLLEQEALASVPSAYVQHGATLHMSAIGIGDLTPVSAQETVLGQALVVPSPVHVRAAYVGSDWQLSWVRRSRSGWRWNDGADAPVAEEQELYRVNLIHNGAIFRTAETGVAQWIYGAADIAADQSAGVSGSVTVEIRQIGTYGLGRPASIDIII